MLTTDQLHALMADLESDRVERTTSTNKTDKFGEAICAFANDLPHHRQPGYLMVGVDDNGNESLDSRRTLPTRRQPAGRESADRKEDRVSGDL